MTGSCPIPVAGAAAEPSILILTGVAGLLAGAFSMAAGEFISMLSQKEMFEHQIAQELWQRSSAGGLRMLLIGTAAAGATYGIGSLFNVAGL
jgi:VIT1/CCC1 family predicted Fe2+/Mn2+ transporter